MWTKAKIAGLHGKRRAWAIPYRGFLIVRLPRRPRLYSVTHAPSGRGFGDGFPDVMQARCFIQVLYLVAAGGAISDPKPLDPAAPMAEFIKAHRETVQEADQAFGFCWPEIEEKRAKVLAQLDSDRKTKRSKRDERR